MPPAVRTVTGYVVGHDHAVAHRAGARHRVGAARVDPQLGADDAALDLGVVSERVAVGALDPEHGTLPAAGDQDVGVAEVERHPAQRPAHGEGHLALVARRHARDRQGDRAADDEQRRGHHHDAPTRDAR